MQPARELRKLLASGRCVNFVCFLKWSVTPSFFFFFFFFFGGGGGGVDSFVLRLSTDCEEMNEIQCGKLKIFFFFFSHAASNLTHLSTVIRV